MRAPRAVRTSSSVARVGLRPMPSRMRLESGKSAAAQRKNAAEEMSPGTVASMACSFCGPEMLTESMERVSVAPKARRASSLWSRVRTDSRTMVVPAVCSPARRTQVLTWALGTGVVKSMARSGVPWMVTGAWPSVRDDISAHFGEGLADALHGSAGEGVVADQGEGAVLRREQAGDHAHGGSGVAAIERMIDRSDATADAVDLDAAVVEFAYACAEGLHAGEGGCAVGSGGEVGEARGAFSKCAEHGVAVADGLVAGKAQGAEDVTCGSDDAFLRGGGQGDSGNWDHFSLLGRTESSRH